MQMSRAFLFWYGAAQFVFWSYPSGTGVIIWIQYGYIHHLNLSPVAPYTNMV